MGEPRRERRRRRTREHRSRARVATAIDRAVLGILPWLTRAGLCRATVNYGGCGDVAEGAQKLLRARGTIVVLVQDDEELCEQDPEHHPNGVTHTWLWVDGFHHDSEARMGVRRWQDLPHYRRWPRVLVAVDPPHVEAARLRATARATESIWALVERKFGRG